MPLKLIDFWFILCLYKPGTQVTYFKFTVGFASYFFQPSISLLWKLIGPQMAGFGTAAGSAHHMPLYIMSFVLFEFPEGDQDHSAMPL